MNDGLSSLFEGLFSSELSRFELSFDVSSNATGFALGSFVFLSFVLGDLSFGDLSSFGDFSFLLPNSPNPPAFGNRKKEKRKIKINTKLQKCWQSNRVGL